MLFSIFNIFFTIVIVLLFVRFFVERYQFYGFGPIMVSVIRISEAIIRPLKEWLPRSALTLRDHMPLVAIGVVIVFRGLMIWVIGPGFTYPFFSQGAFSFVESMAASVTMGVLLLGEMLIAFLFASLMISRRGITMYGNGGFVCFQEKTFSIFNFTKKFISTHNLTVLFFVSAGIIWIATALLAGFTNLSFLTGTSRYEVSVLIALFEVLNVLIRIYSLILILAILSSWIGADQFSAVVQIVRAMTDPYLMIFRRLFPWARIDFIDLSPIFAFIVLSPILTTLLFYVQGYLLEMIVTPAMPNLPDIPLGDTDGLKV